MAKDYRFWAPEVPNGVLQGPSRLYWYAPRECKDGGAIAAMARWDIRLRGTDEQDVAFLHDYHIATPKLDSKGVRVNVLRRAVA